MRYSNPSTDPADIDVRHTFRNIASILAIWDVKARGLNYDVDKDWSARIG